jgi:hypothetical protein
VTRDECKRRLRALIAMPAKERPFSLGLLERLTGMDDCHLKRNAVEAEGMRRNTYRALDRAFTLLENGQAEIKTVCKRFGPYKVTSRALFNRCSRGSGSPRAGRCSTGLP